MSKEISLLLQDNISEVEQNWTLPLEIDSQSYSDCEAPESMTVYSTQSATEHTAEVQLAQEFDDLFSHSDAASRIKQKLD